MREERPIERWEAGAAEARFGEDAASGCPAAALSLRLFGPFEVRHGGVGLGRPRLRKGQWLLALLALRHGSGVERAWLAGTLWPDSSEAEALGSLRRCLTDLRRTLGPEAARLHSPAAGTLALDLAGAAADVVAFDAAIARGDAAALEQAVALYRGPLLEGCAEEWVQPERQAREEAYLGALETLAANALAEGDAAGAAEYLRRVVRTDPLRESAQRGLMAALAAAGSYGAALQAHRDYRLRLQRELNTEPEEETTALYQQIRAAGRRRPAAPDVRPRRPENGREAGGPPKGVIPVPAAAGPVAPASPATRLGGRHNLPVQRTSLVGREAAVETACALLRRDEVGLVTMTGPGGAGKTRLALRVAETLLAEFEDGVFFVSLAPTRDPERVAALIAQTLGILEVGGRPLGESLVHYVREKQLLLLLDNFEQVVEAAPQVAALLAAAPRLKVLMTSRAALHLREEWEFAVGPLPIPVESSELRVESPAKTGSSGLSTLNSELSTLAACPSVQLFVDRARAAKAGFALTVENAAAVAAICRRLEGLPLAIELAAARTSLLPPRALLARLESRLDLLTGGARDLPPRQQTLRAAIAWSYDLLDESEQALFRRLSVFAGGCSLQAAEAVCGGAVGCQPSAIGEDRSHTDSRWLTTDSPPPVALDRIASLVNKSLLWQKETDRGEVRLEMLETLREYGQECLEASGEAAALRDRHAGWFLAWAEAHRGEVALLEAEHDNLRAALAWCLERGEKLPAFRLGASMWLLWHLRGYGTEGRERLAALLAMPEREELAVSRDGGWKGGAQGARSDGEARASAGMASRVAAERAEVSRWRAFLCRQAGQLAWRQSDYPAARRLLEESVALYRAVGRSDDLPSPLNALGEVVRTQGDYATARSLFEESLALLRQQGDTTGTAWALQALGEVACEQGDAAAQDLLEESLAIFLEAGNKRGISFCLSYLGKLAGVQGDFETARVLQEKSLALDREGGDTAGMARSLEYLGTIAADRKEYARARSLYEECLALHRELGDQRGIAVCLERLAGVEIGLAESAAAIPYRNGTENGNSAANTGSRGRARRFPGSSPAGSHYQRGARLLGAAKRLREAIGAPLPPADGAAHERTVAAARASLGAALFAVAWSEGEAMTVDEVIRSVHGDGLGPLAREQIVRRGGGPAGAGPPRGPLSASGRNG